MKNILKIMEEFGLSIPDDKKADFEKAVLENYKTTADYDKQKGKLDAAEETLKANDTALADLKKQLEGFGDADVSGLNKRIEELEKEKTELEKSYKANISDRDFQDILKDSISSANGKNAKAITALLDLESLKGSKNQKEDIAAALKALTEADDSKMLFGEPEPNPVGTGNIIGEVRKSSGNTEDAAMRAAMGLPPVAEQK